MMRDTGAPVVIAAIFTTALIMGVLSFAFGHAIGKIKGRELEAAEWTEYVDRRMEEAGFCGWVRQSTFVQRCLFQTEEK